MNRLPFEIKNQMIQCFGTCFHYKDIVEAFLTSCHVDKELARRHKHEPKFVWARHLLADLEDLENGYLIQRYILTELCKLRNLPDKDAQNPNAGLDSLRRLNILAREHDLIVEEEQKKKFSKRSLAEEKTQLLLERKKLLDNLYKQFTKCLSTTNRQSAGYSLEDILEKLFPLFNLEYRKSYKLKTQQIDGHFKYEGFDYLVEAKWTKAKPTETEIGGFKRKVDTKLESTRGLFLSINGFSPEVIERFSGEKSNIIFMTGEDLTFILEGRIDLAEALKLKIEKAAQEGRVFVSIPEILKKWLKKNV